MDPKQMLKQIVEFNKYTFENAYHSMAIIQSQVERLARMMMNQASWLPEEGKKAMESWVESYKKGAEGFKKGGEESFGRVEEFFEKSK